MRYMWMSQGRTLMTSGTTSAIAHSSMEMGRDQHGLHSQIAQDTEWMRLNMGYSRSIDEGGTLYPSKDRCKSNKLV